MKHISLYQDKGVDKNLLKELFIQCSQKFYCTYISAQEIIHTSWQEKTDILVIPGGRDLPYAACLQSTGTDRIKDFVLKGGCFLGICAGAYFASSYVEFDRRGPLHVEGERELKFFSGKAIGPLFGPFHYSSEKGAKIVPISYQDKRGSFLCHSYYNGGCFFKQIQSSLHIVLATYENGLPAIMRCEVGKGLAILSGVHFEKPLENNVEEEGRKRLMESIWRQFE